MDIPLDSPEKIILVIDTVVEPNSTGFKTSTGAKYNSLYMAKRVCEIFMHNKASFNSRNEFAIMTLDSQNVNWHCDFTRVVEDLIPSLESIKETNGKHEKYFDIQPVFKMLHQKSIDDKMFLEDHIIRVILLYSRSNIIPRFNLVESAVQDLIKHLNFFFDVLYMHESDCEKHKCKEIFAELSNLDIRNSSYIAEVSRNAVKLHDLMAMLYAHPKQRVSQKQFSTDVHPMILKAFEERMKKKDANDD